MKGRPQLKKVRSKKGEGDSGGENKEKKRGAY